MRTFNMRWRAVVFGVFGISIGSMCALLIPHQWHEVNDLPPPRRDDQSEVDHQFDERAALYGSILFSAALTLGGFAWMQWKSLRIQIDDAGGIWFERGWPLIWSKRAIPRDRIAIFVEQRLALRFANSGVPDGAGAGVAWLVVLAAEGTRFLVDVAGSQSVARSAAKELGAAIGVDAVFA